MITDNPADKGNDYLPSDELGPDDARREQRRHHSSKASELIDTKKPSTNWNIDCSVETPWDTAGLDFL